MQDDLYNGLTKWLSYTKPILEKASTRTWNGSDTDQYFDFLKCAAVVRQTEAIQAMLKMDEHEQSHFAVTFLRPALEEVIWIEHLNKHPDLATEVVLLIGFGETTASLLAQNEYLGAKMMQQLGFTQRGLKVQQSENRKREARLREIGRALKWPTDRSLLPSTAWLARNVGRERDYKYLYHATSRFVHFSQRELLRRVWGIKNDMTIGSNMYRRYWRDFALYWGFRIYMDTLIACHSVYGDTLPNEAEWEETKNYLQKFQPVPIITAEELRPPPHL